MKKRIVLLLSLVLTFSVFGFTGCKKDDTNKNEISETAKISEDDAKKIVKDSINEKNYSCSLKDENFNDGKYYLYEITENDISTYPFIAVSKEDGKMVSVFSDNSIEEYDNRYSESRENTKDWTGTYRKGKLSIELSKTDDTSFEFTISDTKNEVFGVAHGNDKEASYKDKEYNLRFELTEDGLKLTDDGKGGISDLSGDYILSE